MTSSVWGNEKTQYFNSLTPDKVLDATDSLNLETSGRVIQLASMENRVYEVEIYPEEVNTPSDHFRILKFYRPGRWSLEQIQDEHQFLLDLNQSELQAIAPLKINGQTVFTNADGLYYAIFPKKGGRACDEWTDGLLAQMGRLLARLHSTGRQRQASSRLKLDIETFGEANLELILKSSFLPKEFAESYKMICEQIFNLSKPLYQNIDLQRIHGDCHHGNIVLNEHPFLIDFDDMSIGPKIQDLWMIVPGRDPYSLEQRQKLLHAYQEMGDFNHQELKLIEVLRSLRIIHFSAWIGHRYEDMAFKRAFPDFGTATYWQIELNNLREQLSYIQESLTPTYY